MNSNSSEVHMAMGEYYKRKKNHETALDEFMLGFADSDINIDRKIQVLLEYYNITQRDKRLLAKVIELGNVACLAHAEDPKSWAVLGDFYARESQKEDALKMYKQSIAVGGNKLLIWNQVLFLNLELKDYHQLVIDSEAAIEIFPNEPFMYLMNGFGHYELKQYQKAIDIMVEGSDYVIDNKPLKAQFFSTIGECYYRLGDYPNSDKYFDKCLAEDPNNVLVLNNYAYYLSLRNEKLDQAAEMSSKSNRLHPNNGTYQDTYAWVLFKQGKYEDALVWIEKAIANGAGGSAVVVEHYGDILYQLGRKEDAHTQWKKAKELGEGSDKLNEKVLYSNVTAIDCAFCCFLSRKERPCF
jgi:tetratricopeptide (TPR) repeat protein